MAISLVQQSKSQTNSSSTTASYGTSPTSGNILIAIGYTNGTTSALNISGFTSHEVGYSGTGQSIGVFYKVSDGTESSITLNGNTICRLHITEWSGLANPIATDGQNSNTVNSVKSINTNSISTTNADDLIITAAANSTGSSGTRNWSNSFNTLADDASSPRLLSGYLIATATGSYDSTAQLHTSNSNSGALIIAFKQSSSSLVRTKSKISGTFSSKPIKVKTSGTFTTKTTKVKTSGTFI